MTDLKKMVIVAGDGTLPLMAAKIAAKRGISVTTIVFFQKAYDKMKPLSHKIYHLHIGQAKKVIATLKKEAIEDLIMVGKFEKKMLFEKIKFDLKALNILRKIKNKNDETIMSAIADEFEKIGINVLNQTLFLKDFVPKRGVLNSKRPSYKKRKDIEYGFELAKKVTTLDIGQTVVVKDLAVLAVEAIEGTDEAIKRGTLLGKKDAVIVKVSKPNQDFRFDVPTIGINTIKTMIVGDASTLAVEAGKTLIVDKNQIIKLADKNGISIVAI